MKERILKKISMYNVKILQQERLLQYYIERGFEYHDDTSLIKTKLYCYKEDVSRLKKLLSRA